MNFDLFEPPRRIRASTSKNVAPANRKVAAADYSATCASVKAPRKIDRILKVLLDGEALNRFEAYRRHSDSCLNSTISALEKRGLVILRLEEEIPGYRGLPVRCKRYWLSPQSRELARQLLEKA